jgi:hypothetical protein
MGFHNQEPERILSFEIVDLITVALRDGELRRLA